MKLAMLAIILTALLSVAGCGADGPPVPPKAKPTPNGTSVSISGDARVGVVKTF